MLSIEMLPARHGDCLWIEYAESVGDRPRRILIDGGPGFAYGALRARIEQLPQDEREFELLVVTHIDADHIEGIIRLVGDPSLGVRFGEVWYNAWKQIAGDMPSFGAESGEYLSALLRKRELPWNRAFGQHPGKAVPVVAGVDPVRLEGGANLTVLSPTPAKLARLRQVWEQELQEAGVEPDAAEAALERLKRSKRFKGVSFARPDPATLAAAASATDAGAANGSSIALLLEAGGGRLLLGADAHPDVLEASIAELLRVTGGGRLRVDAVKLPHHGSENNVSRALIARLESPRWLLSSDGTFFRHPDPEAVSRVIVDGGAAPEIYFNYRSKITTIWDDSELMSQYGYRAFFPEANGAGLRIDLVSEKAGTAAHPVTDT